MEKFKVFQYSQGDQWKIKVVVSNWNSFTYHDLQCPDTASVHEKESFLADAENAVLVRMAELEEEKYGS